MILKGIAMNRLLDILGIMRRNSDDRRAAARLFIVGCALEGRVYPAPATDRSRRSGGLEVEMGGGGSRRSRGRWGYRMDSALQNSGQKGLLDPPPAVKAYRCPKCGAGTAEPRFHGASPVLFYIRCGSCGYRTMNYPTPEMAKTALDASLRKSVDLTLGKQVRGCLFTTESRRI